MTLVIILVIGILFIMAKPIIKDKLLNLHKEDFEHRYSSSIHVYCFL